MGKKPGTPTSPQKKKTFPNFVSPHSQRDFFSTSFPQEKGPPSAAAFGGPTIRGPDNQEFDPFFGDPIWRLTLGSLFRKEIQREGQPPISAHGSPQGLRIPVAPVWDFLSFFGVRGCEEQLISCKSILKFNLKKSLAANTKTTSTACTAHCSCGRKAFNGKDHATRWHWYVPWSKVAILGMVIPPLIGILIMVYINPY